MTPMVIIFAFLSMPNDPVTSTLDWYAPVEIIEIEAEPTEIELEHEWLRRRVRILELNQQRQRCFPNAGGLANDSN